MSPMAYMERLLIMYGNTLIHSLLLLLSYSASQQMMRRSGLGTTQ